MSGKPTIIPTRVGIVIILALLLFYLSPPYPTFWIVKDSIGMVKAAIEDKIDKRGLGQWQRARWEKEGLVSKERRERLSAPLRGYVEAEQVMKGTFEFAIIGWCIGPFPLYLYRDGFVVHGSIWSGDEPFPENLHGDEYTKQECELLVDIANIVVKDSLSRQGDLWNPRIYDGATVKYGFSFGEYEGGFDLTNIRPDSLERFCYKVDQLMEATRSAHFPSSYPDRNAQDSRHDRFQ